MDIALSLAIVIATLAGPVLAVYVTRRIDADRQKRDRQMTVFRALMATRRIPLSPDKVNALNMVEIEFYGVPAVEEAYRTVMAHINHLRPLPPKWNEELRKLTTKLLSEMAKVLNYELQQLDMLDGGYYPQGLVDIEGEQQAVRQALVEVLSGRRPLLTSPSAPTPPAPFPPPPAPSQVESKSH
ncbi:DUF6680 family protein [Acidisphaera sp. S103]|uniref:DUF6680 family protein n=1 Tax=Acidisphaera sp. S103 TaxID=1747223 RepID=UPI00131B6B51|nr:DUF6680 family protein [Acidisphaera sp. S103]